MRDRIPFLFAALLVAGLIAIVGIAAFSITDTEEPPAEVAVDGVVSGRVASAILAASVSAPVQPARGGDIQAIAPQSASEPTLATESTEAPASSSTSTAPETPTTTAEADTTPPPLVITAPDDGATVTNSVVEFTGTSEPGAVVTSGPFAADMEDDGDWLIKLVVGSGYNGTVFTARDAAGNETSVRITVLYEVAPSPTTTRAPSPSPTTTSAPTPTTSPPPPSNCPVSGACSPQWPADPKQGHGREYWRSAVERHWGAGRAECVLDLIQVESGGDPQARAHAGYLGLMQHSPGQWNKRAMWAGFSDGNLTAHPYNGEANIAAGAALADREGSDWWKHWPPTSHIASCQVHRNG